MLCRKTREALVTNIRTEEEEGNKFPVSDLSSRKISNIIDKQSVSDKAFNRISLRKREVNIQIINMSLQMDLPLE